MMHLIDVFGHFAFRRYTSEVVDKYVEINEKAFLGKRKEMMDDYLIQKSYLKTKKDNQTV